MIDLKFRGKIIDLGDAKGVTSGDGESARTVSRASFQSSLFHGTFAWSAPEMLLRSKFTEKVRAVRGACERASGASQRGGAASQPVRTAQCVCTLALVRLFVR